VVGVLGRRHGSVAPALPAAFRRRRPAGDLVQGHHRERSRLGAGHRAAPWHRSELAAGRAHRRGRRRRVPPVDKVVRRLRDGRRPRSPRSSTSRPASWPPARLPARLHVRGLSAGRQHGGEERAPAADGRRRGAADGRAGSRPYPIRSSRRRRLAVPAHPRGNHVPRGRGRHRVRELPAGPAERRHL
jgi:hypothetical protein